jgi:hypothetical protein
MAELHCAAVIEPPLRMVLLSWGARRPDSRTVAYEVGIEPPKRAVYQL